MTGSLESWTVLFTVAVKVCADTPMMIRVTPKSQ